MAATLTAFRKQLATGDLKPAYLIAGAEHLLVIEAADRVGLAVDRYRQGGAGFSDHMIALAAQEAQCRLVLSFDRKAVAQAGMSAVPAAS